MTEQRELPSPEEVDAQIYKILADLKDVSGIALSPTTTFASLALSSLDVLTLAFELEDRYDISIRDAYLDDFRTIGEASTTVRTLLAKRR